MKIALQPNTNFARQPNPAHSRTPSHAQPTAREEYLCQFFDPTGNLRP